MAYFQQYVYLGTRIMYYVSQQVEINCLRVITPSKSAINNAQNVEFGQLTQDDDD